MKLYLDICVYNRPFDDQGQPRIMIETQIAVILFAMALEGRYDFINSFALEYENRKNPNFENMQRILNLLSYSANYVSYNEDITARARELEKRGVMAMDALHISCAEKAKADFFVTCDDRLIRKMKKIDNIRIECYNIIDFAYREVF